MKHKKLWILALSLLLISSAFLAGCQPATYQVSFTGESVSVEAQTVEEGQTASRPADPVREGYRFDGWYLGEVLYTFAEAVTENITLTAKWSFLGYTGAGTSESPMVIADPQGLSALAGMAASGPVYAELAADLTLPEGFASVGTTAQPFRGRFDGKGHTISGLSAPLFGGLREAEVLDLTLSGTVQTEGAAGGLAAEAGENTLLRSVRSEVTVGGTTAGGLIGQTSGRVTAIYCSASGNVTGTAAAGGLVGRLGNDGFLLECVASGSVSGGTAGGLVGQKLGGSALFDCYAHGGVTASGTAGPVVGSVVTDVLNTQSYVINTYYNAEAGLEGSDYNYADGMPASDIENEIAWLEGAWSFDGGCPVPAQGTATLPEQVAVKILSGPQPEGTADGVLTLGYLDPLNEAAQQKSFAGWFIDDWYMEGFPEDMPLIKDVSLAAAEGNPGLLERVWMSKGGRLDLTEDGGYTLIGCRYLSDYTYLNETVYLLERNGNTYRASILAEEGTLLWQTLSEGEWSEGQIYMADFSRFLGSWTYVGEGYELDLIVTGDYDADGFLEVIWQEELWQANAKVAADGSIRLYLGWYTEFFFNDAGVLSYDYGFEVHEYQVSERLASGAWLSLDGRVIAVDAEAGTIEWNGVTAAYTTEAGENGAVLTFTADGTACTLQSYGDSVRLRTASGRTDFYPYLYEDFIGSWSTGDLADTYVIGEDLTISRNGGQPVQMSPSIYNNALMYTFTLDNEIYTLTLEFGYMLDMRSSQSGSQPVYLFDRELLAYFQGSYTDLVTDYVIDENYRITRTPSAGGEGTSAQGEFLFVDMEDGTGVITYVYAMDETVYMLMFQTVEPVKLLLVADMMAPESYQFCYDRTQISVILDEFRLENDAWITGGKQSSTVSVSQEGLVTVDGTTFGARLSLDEIYFAPSLVLDGDPYGGSDTYQLTAYLGTLYMLNLSTLAWPDASTGDEGNTDYRYYVPASEVERFTGTFVFNAVDGPEYVVYREDGSCLISTQITDEEGNTSVQLLEYEDIYFFTSINLLDPTQSLTYLAFNAGTYIPAYEGWYIFVVMTGNSNYVSITAINYVRENAAPYVGIYRGEDNSKLELNDKGSFVIGGEESEAPVYTVQEDGTLRAVFTLNETEYTAVLATDAASGSRTVSLTTGETTLLYTLFPIPMAELAGIYTTEDGETLVFVPELQAASLILTVTVDGTAAGEIEYAFDENGNLVCLFTVGVTDYEVTFTEGEDGTWTISVQKSGLLPPPPPPPPPAL